MTQDIPALMARLETEASMDENEGGFACGLLREAAAVLTKLQQDVVVAKAETRMFAQAADTEKAEANHWRSEVARLRAALEQVEQLCEQPVSAIGPMIRPSELEGDEQWQRNGEYVSVFHVRKVIDAVNQEG
jgi:hypothetical protein